MMNLWTIIVADYGAGYRNDGKPFQLELEDDATVMNIKLQAMQLNKKLTDVSDLEVWEPAGPPSRHARHSQMREAAGSQTYSEFFDDFAFPGDDAGTPAGGEQATLVDDNALVSDVFTDDTGDKLQVLVRKLPSINRSVLGKRPWEGLDLAAAAVEPFEQIERPSLIGPSVRAKVDRMIIAGPIDETIPVALYHPALAQLTHDLQNRMFGPGNEDLSEFNSGLLEECEHFRLSSCEHYAREDDRLPSTLKFLNAALDAAGHEKPRYFRRNEKNPFAIPDLVWGTQVIRRNEMSLVPYVIGEIKRDRGEGDTILQCTNDYGVIVHNYEREDFFRSSLFPMVLIGVEGPVIRIAIAIRLERVVINEFLALDLRTCSPRMAKYNLARIHSALTDCAVELRAEYGHALGPSKAPVSFYPSPTPDPRYEEPGILPKLKYTGRLSRKNEVFSLKLGLKGELPTLQDMQSLYLAEYGPEGSAVQVVVKFAIVYNADAHKVLVEDPPLAPKLYACHRVIGERYIVVMERLRGQQPLALFFGQMLDESVYRCIEAAIKRLHVKGYVFGDLRAPNILVSEDGTAAKLVDFDWVGRDGVARYPHNIDTEAHRLEWHPKVTANGIMMKEHDLLALFKIRSTYFWNSMLAAVNP